MERPIPDFVFVGPKRTGTTWIHAYLERVAGILLPARMKETFYFDRFHERGPDWYRSLFDLPERPRSDVRVGELSPSYFHAPEVPDRIHTAAPHCQVIVTLRHPYRRMVSLYFHHQRSGTVPRGMTLAEALQTRPFLLESGRYATHTRRWIDRFGPDHVHVLYQEELSRDPSSFARRLTDILDVEPVAVPHALVDGIGRGELPRSFLLARVAQRTVAWLRRRELVGVIRLGGRLGLRRLLMGGRPLPQEQPTIPPWAKDVLREETAGLADLGIKTPDWDL